MTMDVKMADGMMIGGNESAFDVGSIRTYLASLLAPGQSGFEPGSVPRSS